MDIVEESTTLETVFNQFEEGQRNSELKRRDSHGSIEKLNKRPRLQSLSLDWEIEADPEQPVIVAARGDDSPSSSGESIFEEDWESFLPWDEILPASYWEVDITNYEAGMTDYHGYEGLLEDFERQDVKMSGAEVWDPYEQSSFADVEIEETSIVAQFEDQSKICYGMVPNVRVKMIPHEPQLLASVRRAKNFTQKRGEQDIYVFEVVPEGKSQNFLLRPPPRAETSQELQYLNNLAVVNRETSAILSLIAHFCTLEAVCSIVDWIPFANRVVRSSNESCVLVDVNIYGLPKHWEEVGDSLSAKKVYLQEPNYRDLRYGYRNPHFLELKPIDSVPAVDPDPLKISIVQTDFDSQQLEISSAKVSTKSLMKQKLSDVFNTTTRSHTLKRVAADTSRVHTVLKPYQEEALDFIIQRESGPIPTKFRLWQKKDPNSYIHAITGFEKHEVPEETGGGILADEMGLGKTLTMLSAIIRTTDDARSFAFTMAKNTLLTVQNTLIPSRATFVVVPSPLLLTEWLQEIKLHCSGFSKPVIYHGHGREGNPQLLADADIVLSTYHTIAAESKDTTSPLWKIKWFRIVLDEAHYIRHMTTRLSKSVKKLKAKFRWCLTGTPVQNGLEDLAALVNFIQSSPLDEFRLFKKHIISPLTKGYGTGLDNLRQLLDSVCLRRTNQLLELAEVIYETRLLDFSPGEKIQYVDTRDKMVRIISQNSFQPHNKGCLGVFQLQLHLRRLCNHGTFQKSATEVGDFDPEQALAYLKRMNSANCEVCGIHTTGVHGIEEQRSGTFTTCGHLLCSKCIPRMKAALQKIDGQDGSFQCSLCPATIVGEYLVFEATSSKGSRFGHRNLSAWQYFAKDGCSTKIFKLVADIEQYEAEGKSIVFSCWTRSLDLVGIFLKSREIVFVRIDGSHTPIQRQRILDIFQTDPKVKILLMTTGTGAVGLNLTVANCVYILEPQWNPMVESQAIARVNRMGQTRNVRVVRYIMKGTVEELELHQQQTRKLELAKVGWKEDDCQ